MHVIKPDTVTVIPDFYQQVESVFYYKCALHSRVHLSICCHRELLVIGGVAAREQLNALEQGVCDVYCLQTN